MFLCSSNKCSLLICRHLNSTVDRLNLKRNKKSNQWISVIFNQLCFQTTPLQQLLNNRRIIILEVLLACLNNKLLVYLSKWCSSSLRWTVSVAELLTQDSATFSKQVFQVSTISRSILRLVCLTWWWAVGNQWCHRAIPVTTMDSTTVDSSIYRLGSNLIQPVPWCRSGNQVSNSKLKATSTILSIGEQSLACWKVNWYCLKSVQW